MARTLCVLFLLLLTLVRPSAQDFEWLRQFDLGETSAVSMMETSENSNGEIANSGWCRGRFAVDDSVYFAADSDKQAGFLIVHNSDGELIWAKFFSNSYSHVRCMASVIDDAGNVNVLVENFSAQPYSFLSGDDIIIRDHRLIMYGFDSAGNLISEFVITAQSVNSVRMSSNTGGDLLVTAHFRGSMDNPVMLGDEEVSFPSGVNNCFLTFSLDLSGGLAWSYPLFVGQPLKVEASFMEESGGALLAGWFQGERKFNGSSEDPSSILVSGYGRDGFLVKIGPSGEFQWVRHLDSNSSTCSVNDVHRTEESIVIVGSFRGAIHLVEGGEGLDFIANGEDGFIAKLSVQGNILWASHLSSEASLIPDMVGITSNEEVFCAGVYDMNLSIQDVLVLESSSQSNQFYLLFDNDGLFSWGFDIKGIRPESADIVTGGAKEALFANGMSAEGYLSVHPLDSLPVVNPDRWFVSKYSKTQATGCMDAAASNYVSSVAYSQYCIYRGCTDEEACNFMSSANIDDGSCEYNSCLGCTYPEAQNFNPAAILDDGSCIIYQCRGDFNGDGRIDVQDFILFNSDFGSQCE